MSVDIRPWCNGSTSDSDSENRGSSPCGRTNFKGPTLLVALLLLSFQFGCARVSSSRGRELGINPEFALNSSEDPQIEQESERLLSFLEGQLALNDEEHERALKALSSASNQTEDPSSILHSQLTLLYLHAGNAEGALKESAKELQGHRTVAGILMHAGILEALGRFDDAVPFYKEVIAQDPDFTSPYVLLTSIAFMQGTPVLAEEALRDLVKRKPKEVSGYFYLARVLEALGRSDEAEKELAQAVKIGSGSERIGLDYVRVLIKNGKKAEAKKTLTILAKDSSHGFSKQLLDLTKTDGEYELISEKLAFLGEAEKDPTEVREKIALALIERNNLEQAARELLLVLARNPSNSRARYYLGSVFAASGRKSLGVEELMKIKKGEPMFLEARTFASFLYRQLEDSKGAERAIREALTEKEDDFNLQLMLVDVLRENKSYREALSIAEKLLLQDPKNEKLLFVRAIIMHDLGKESDSLVAMEEVLAVNPDHPQALNYVAYNLTEQGQDLDRAGKFIDRALEIEPDDGYFLDTLGWLQYRKGDYKAAVKTLERAVNMTGGDPLISEHYGDALLKEGNIQRAAVVYNSVLTKTGRPEDKDEENALERIKEKLDSLLRVHPDLSTAISK